MYYLIRFMLVNENFHGATSENIFAVFGWAMNHQMCVTIVRHGETHMNAKRLIQGHTDAALSEVGIKQAETLGKHLASEKFTRAFTSHLQRAHHTAQVILSVSENPIEVVIDKRICERGFGEAEGRFAPDVMEEAKRQGVSFSTYTPPGGETLSDVQDRVEDFFNDLCAIADEQRESENVLVVTHGGFVVALMRFLASAGKRFSLKHFNEANAMKIPRNTGYSKFSISALNSNNTKKRVIDFICINCGDHLVD